MTTRLPILELATSYKQLPGPHHLDTTPNRKSSFHPVDFDATEKSPGYIQKIHEIMRYEQRTYMEAKLLYEHIKDFPFFESFNQRNSHNHLETEAFIQLCEKARFEKHPSRKVLYREGDAPNGKVYLIYSGSVFTVTKNPKTYIPENSSCIDISSESIEDISDERTADEPQQRKRESEDSTGHPHQAFVKPSLFSTKSAKNLRVRKISGMSPKEMIVLREESNRSPNLAGNAENNNMSLEKKRRQSRTSIYIHNSVNALDQGEHDSDPSLTKLGQKLVDMQNELKAQQRNPNAAGGIVNFIKLSRWADQDSNEPTERKRGSSFHFDSNGNTKAKIIGTLTDGFSPASGDHPAKISNNYPSLKQLITDNGWLKSKITRGGFFGEKALFSKKPRPATIVTATECEFLVFSKNLFQSVVEKYDLQRKELIDFMHCFVPAIENITSGEVVEDVAYAFEEKIYERDSFISREGEHGTKFFLMYEGTCEVLKKISIKEKAKTKEPLDPVQKLIRVQPHQTQEIPVCTVNRGQWICEEIVFGNKDRETYDLSVRVYSAQARVLVIDKYRFFAKFPEVSRNKLCKNFQNKRRNHIEMIMNYVSNKYPQFDIAGPTQQEISQNLDLVARGNIKLVPKIQSRLSVNHGLGLDLVKSPSSSRGLLNLSGSKTGGVFLSPLRSDYSGTLDEYSPYSGGGDQSKGVTSIMKTDESPKGYNKNYGFVSDRNNSNKDDEIILDSETQKLKRKMGAFSRTTVNLKLRGVPEDNNHLSNSNNSRGSKKYTILLNNSIPQQSETQTPLLTPSLKLSQQENLLLAPQRSQSGSHNRLPKIHSPREPNPSNFKQFGENRILGDDDGEGPEVERQDSLGLTLQALVRDKGIRQYLIKHKTKHIPKNQSEALHNDSSGNRENGNNDKSSPYTFNKKLESMLDKAKKKKTKRMNRVTSLIKANATIGGEAVTDRDRSSEQNPIVHHQTKYQLPNIKVITNTNFFSHPKTSRSFYVSQTKREDTFDSGVEDGLRLEDEIFSVHQPETEQSDTPTYKRKSHYQHHTLKKSSVYMKILGQTQDKTKKENKSNVQDILYTE